MLELYQFARTMAVSVTPDPRYIPEVERETLARLRSIQRELMAEGYDEVLAGLMAIKQLEDESRLAHLYPSRDWLATRSRVLDDAIQANPWPWLVALGVLGALAALTLAVSLAMLLQG